jgi:hypothetical protein
MKWQLEELTEDALVSYLRGACGGLRVSAAWERDEMQYPACVVHVGSSAPISESADWHDPRALAVTVAVITEGVHELAADGTVFRTARNRNADARSQVMDALFRADLLTKLIEQGAPDIAFSMAQFSETARTVDGRNLVTTLSGAVIAEPVTGS